MSKIPQFFSEQITSLTAAELTGVTCIQANLFYYNNLKTIQIPSTVEIIHENAFRECDRLEVVEFKSPCLLREIRENAFYGSGDYTFQYGGSAPTLIGLDNLDPYCKLGSKSINGYAFVSEHRYDGSFLYAAHGKILLCNKKLTGNFVIPDGVVHLGPESCGWYYAGTDEDTTTTSMIIPDTVEMVGYDVFMARANLTTITIGSSVRYMDSFLYALDKSATLIFRQPSGMTVELPTPGDKTGLAYNKSSRAITVYTDNECIRNYDWATDNATVTFYPLADAPT